MARLTLLTGTILLLAPLAQAQNPPAIEWKRCLGGSSYDEIWDIEQTSDGGYIAAMITQSSDGDVTGYHGQGDIWMVKLSGAGAIEWQRALGGSGVEGMVDDVEEASDGGFLIAGYTSSNDGDVSGVHGSGDIWVVKLSASGTLVWQRPVGGSTALGENFPDGYTSPPCGGPGYWCLRPMAGATSARRPIATTAMLQAITASAICGW